MKSKLDFNFFVVFGLACKNLLEALKLIIKGQIEFDQFKRNLIFIGYECLPIIIALTCVSCMIMTLNTATELNNFGGRELIGPLVSVSNLREILPMFIAFAIAARCGTAMAAEISTMKVTEQIDALKVMNAGPIYFIVAPRLLATICIIPFLLAIASILSTYSGMLIAKLITNLEFEYFLETAWKAISIKEYTYPLIKTEIFSVFSILVNISLGLACRGGAREVGITTTTATAIVMIGIIVLDGILTPLLYI